MGITAIIAAALAGLGSILAGLKGSGVNIGSIGTVALQTIETTEQDEANYLAGQAVVVGTLSYDGQPGTIVVVKNGGPAAQSLGL
jgi:hypothetical protein